MNRTVATNRNEAIRWARGVLEKKDKYLIFDTETTGLKESDVIIHFAVMDLDGKMLIDTKVKPMSKRRMSQDASYIHGMTMKDLKDAPLFEEIVEVFRPLAANKMLLSYNARFHGQLFLQTYQNEGVSGDPMELHCIDVKDQYVKFTGIYNAALPGRKNTGVGDCLATLEVIKRMAEGELIDVPIPKKSTEMNYWLGVFLASIAVSVLINIGFC